MSWQQVQLGEVADIISGATPKSTVPGYWGGEIAWATPTDLSNLKAKHIASTERRITDAGLKSCSARLLPPNSVLFSSRAPIGLVAINRTPMATNQGFKSFVPSEDLTADYLYWWLVANKQQIQDLGNGATFKEVSKGIVSNVKIPLPPVREQRRIAAILDKADAIRRKRQQSLALADDFLKSVFLEMFGDPETNPKRLPQEELGELLERIDSGHSPKCEARPAAEDEIGILKVSSISSTHFKPEENKAVFEGYPIDERNLVHSGDLLLSRKNTYQLVGASAIVENIHGKLALPDLIFRLVPRPDRKIEIPYLWMLLTQDSIRERLRKVAGGSAASMPNIGKERLRSVLLPIAKPEDQVQFTKYYSKRISLKQKLQENLTVTEDLFASLSQRAFRGEL